MHKGFTVSISTGVHSFSLNISQINNIQLKLALNLTFISLLKEIKFDGLVTWGVEHQLIPVAFGLYKLRISVVVENDKVSQTDIEDVINGDGRGDEIISSVDLHVESKVKLPW